MIPIPQVVLLRFISIGNHVGFECSLGIIARATGKVIARAIASAIYDCCECNYSQNGTRIHIVIKY